jgi:hypothetical protein
VDEAAETRSRAIPTDVPPLQEGQHDPRRAGPGADPAEGHRACARYVMEERIAVATAPVLLTTAAGLQPRPATPTSSEPNAAHERLLKMFVRDPQWFNSDREG